MTSTGSTAWEGLAPWEKAHQWMKAAPELAGEVVEMGRLRALQVWELDQKRIEHQQALELAESAHRHKQEFRLWLLQLISVLGGFLAVAANAIIAYKYAASGNVVPGLAVFAAGGALTSGIYFAGRGARQKLEKALESRNQVDDPAEEPKAPKSRTKKGTNPSPSNVDKEAGE
jgi:hypothetical protein